MSDAQTPCTALVIDDEARIRSTLEGVLEDEGWNVLTAESGLKGLQVFARQDIAIVLLDVWMQGLDGIETLQRMRQLKPEIPIVIMSGHGTLETAVRATRLGAFEYLEKPLSLEKIFPLLEQAKKLKGAGLGPSSAVPDLIGSTPALIEIKRQIQLVAPKNACVLITGENGTGKEVVAQQIHHRSARSKKPFIAVNCAAIPEELIESELFGHVKGAFTNAIAPKKGKFELAHQGTLFLDEVGDMSLRTQAKILRILQEQQFERLGSTEQVQVDVRILAATNQDLKAMIAEGKFREDLFYRLNVVPFHLPPLRERFDDLPELTAHFLGRMARELGESPKTLSSEALAVMRGYPWPGNIRELRNFLERVCIMNEQTLISGEVVKDYLGIGEAEAHAPASDFLRAGTYKEAKLDFERAYILGKLEENQWNITKTADAIGLERSHLHRKMKLCGIEPKQKG